MKCPTCGHTFIQNRPHHTYCSTYCRNRANWLRNKDKTRKGPLSPKAMKEKVARSQETRVRNAIASIPDRYVLILQRIIAHKLSLPAQLISVRSVIVALCKQIKIDKSDIPWHMKEGLHRLISRRLEDAGGKLSDFNGWRASTDIDEKAHARRIYRFPPLKER